MTRSFARKLLTLTCAAFLMEVPSALHAQATASLTQTINKRNTIGVLNGSISEESTNIPLTSANSTQLKVGTEILFGYQLFTAGAPVVTTEPLLMFDGSNPLTPVNLQVQQVSAVNLLPYSQVSTVNGWVNSGATATITANAAGGPDGSASTTTLVAFPDTTVTSSSVNYTVSSTTYASVPLTFSIWIKSTAAASITLGIADGAGANQTTAVCNLTSNVWSRCTVTGNFPASPTAGFKASIISASTTAQSVQVWGAQVEQASEAGPYVSTIGTARPTGGQAEVATFAYDDFEAGSHNVTVQYGGDTNFIGSTSNAVSFTLGKGAATIVLASSLNPSVYGQPVTLTATVTGINTIVPDGKVTFLDGATAIASNITLGSCNSATLVCTASITLDGAAYALLAQGTHSVTAALANDDNYDNITSAAVPQVVTPASASTALSLTLASSLNPSTYGDAITFTVQVQSQIANALTLNGTVTVTDGATALGTITCNNVAICSGTLTIPGVNGTVTDELFTAGTHTITATYSGDSNYTN